MKTFIAALIWGIVNSTMVCKTSGGLFDNSRNAPWSD